MNLFGAKFVLKIWTFCDKLVLCQICESHPVSSGLLAPLIPSFSGICKV